MMEKEKKVAIEKIVLNIEGEKVSLTPEQAKKLKSLLDEMFGKEVIRVEEHHHHDYPRWYWNYSTPNWVYCATTSNLTTKGSTGSLNLTGNATSSNVLCSNSTLEIKL